MKTLPIKTPPTMAALAAALLLASGVAHAQEFPSQPIEVVTHASAGGGTDATARTMLIRARRTLENEAFVNGKTGGAGVVAMSYVSGKPADGHTLMAITPTHLTSIARGKAPIGINDIKGVVRSTDDPIVIVTHKDTGITSLDSLRAESEKSPVKWGGTQAGGVDHIAQIVFSRQSGIDVSYVPFDGGGAIVTNLMGGNLQAAGLNYGEARDQIEAGDFIPIAIMARERLGILPDTPTLEELGVSGVNFSTVRGIVVMSDTPDERVAVLEEGLLKAMKHSTYQNYLAGIGLDPGSVAGSEVWDAQIREMYANIEQVLTELGLK
ncbi:MAG: tripartite tricarboxylate transporter substrate binding protein [Alphaproteobacteria bacterium]|nr:tripartite tricarboxylate transporter substrate binding protein [Alphaproteobacteria bacterium]